MESYENLQVKLRYFVKSTRDHNWSLDDHLPYYNLVFMLDGSATYTLNGVTKQLRRGDVMLIQPGSHRQAQTTQMYLAALDFETNDVHLDLPLVFHIGYLQHYIDALDVLGRAWLLQDTAYGLKCNSLLMGILHQLICDQHTHKHHATTNQIKHFIAAHYQTPLTVQTLAEHVGLSPIYCGALFKKHEGLTIGNYLNRIRINAATTLLKENTHTIAEIADEVGFCDAFYFSKVFKQVTGIAPSAYKHNQLG